MTPMALTDHTEDPPPPPCNPPTCREVGRPPESLQVPDPRQGWEGVLARRSRLGFPGHRRGLRQGAAASLSRGPSTPAGLSPTRVSCPLCFPEGQGAAGDRSPRKLKEGGRSVGPETHMVSCPPCCGAEGAHHPSDVREAKPNKTPKLNPKDPCFLERGALPCSRVQGHFPCCLSGRRRRRDPGPPMPSDGTDPRAGALPWCSRSASHGRDARIGLKSPPTSPRGSGEHGKATGAPRAAATEPSGTI